MATGSLGGSGLSRLGHVTDLRAGLAAVAARRARWGHERFAEELERLLDPMHLPGEARRDAIFACMLHLVRTDDAELDELASVAARAGSSEVARLLGGPADAACRALAPGGRLADVGLARTTRLVARFDYVVDEIVGEPPPLEAWEEPAPTEAPDFPWDDPPFDPRVHWPEREQAVEPRWHSLTLPPNHVLLRRRAAQLARHPDPFTIGRLLDAPATRLADAMSVAARRPTTRALVQELVKRDRWISRLEIRAALASNPFTPTRTARLLVVTCGARLRRLDGANVDPTVRATAERWARGKVDAAGR